MRKRLYLLYSILKDEDRKGIMKICIEFINCSIKNRELALHYFTRMLYKKDIDNYMDYVTNKEMYKIRYTYQDNDDLKFEKILNDKVQFYKFCKSKNIKTPEIIAYNYKTIYFINDIKYEVNKKVDLLYLLDEILSINNELFLKPIEGSCGIGCFVLNRNNKDEYIDILLNNDYIYQEIVFQNKVLSDIYKYSLNTLRIDTYVENGEVNILSAYIRFGNGKSIIDNASNGGCFVPINMKDGNINSIGFTLFHRGADRYSHHPYSKKVFKGRKVPMFEEAKELVVLANKKMPNTLTGWDIAISETGPTIIEGNPHYHLNISDIAYGGYKKHEIYKTIIKKYS